jgi:hypothetical protein
LHQVEEQRLVLFRQAMITNLTFISVSEANQESDILFSRDFRQA